MQFTTTLVAFLPLIGASHLPALQHVFSNPTEEAITSGFRIPTVHESAVQARRILRLSSIGTLSTVFPSSSSSDVQATENRPSDVSGTPIGLMDYIGDCESSGDPTILAIKIATSFKNVASGSNISVSLRWVPPPPPPGSRPRFHSPAALPRFSLIGHLEDISAADVRKEAIPVCFLKYHPDAAAWLPGNRIHESKWTRLVVEEMYWVGGFGDRAYIGWIPVEEWRGVTQEEIDAIRLPGEKSCGDSASTWGWKSLKAWIGWEDAQADQSERVEENWDWEL